MTTLKYEDSLSFVHKLNYLYIIWAIVFPALQNNLLPVDGMGRSYMILTLTCWAVNIANQRFRNTLKTSTIIYWILWSCIVGCVWIYWGKLGNPNAPRSVFFFRKFIFPVSILIIAHYECRMNPQRLIQVAAYSLLFYLLIGIFFASSQHTWEDENRGGGTMGNDLPLAGVVALAFFFFLYCQKRIDIKKLILVGGIAIYTAFWVATRKALVADAIIIVFFIVSKIKLNLKSILILTVSVIAANYVFDFVINNSYIGQRFQEAAESNTNIYDTNWFLHLVSDRAVFYVLGEELFMRYPIFGIGIWNFMDMSGYPICIHPEYVVQYCETGIVGSILFILFNLSIYYKALKARPCLPPSVFWLIIGAMVAINFIELTAWTYDGPKYFVLFGTLVGLSENALATKKERLVLSTYK